MTMEETWESVEYALCDAKAVTWDECHKIYVLMDDEQVATMTDYGYDPILPVNASNQDKILTTLQEWYEDSCSLRFINSVRTVKENPNEGFCDLIPQFADESEE